MDQILGAAVPFLISNFTGTFFVVGVVVALIVILVRRPDAHGVAAAFFDWFLFFAIGVTYTFNGIMHTVFGDMSAARIGWENNGFQAEVGFASIGMGLIAFMSFPKRAPHSLKFAALVGPACFLWGAAGTHIVDIVESGNFSPDNAGLILYTDIFTPIIGLGLWWWSYATRPRDAAPSTARASGQIPLVPGT